MNRNALTTQRTTMSQVARRARVSQPAVSAVLGGGSSTTAVGKAARLRILEAARQLNYRPDLNARGLVSGRSFLIGVLCREHLASFVSEILCGIQDVVGQRDYSVVSYTHGDTADDEMVHLRRSLDRRVDGLIMMPALDPDGRTNTEQVSRLRDEGMPIVQLFVPVLPGIPAVVRDYYNSGKQAVEHLVALGHRRILHVTHNRYAEMEKPTAYQDARDRARGYSDAMKSHGLEPNIFTVPSLDHRSSFASSARAAAARVLHHPGRATAIVAYNDYIAQGLAKGLDEFGADVPRDMSIVGSDNLEFAALSIPAITTLAPPIRQCGRAAAEMIFDLMDNKSVPDRVLPHELIVRESTAPLPDSGGKEPRV